MEARVVDGRRPTRTGGSCVCTAIPLPFGTQCHYGASHNAVATTRRKENPMAEQTAPQSTEEPTVEETLVEEVSIDGMCGVY